MPNYSNKQQIRVKSFANTGEILRKYGFLNQILVYPFSNTGSKKQNNPDMNTIDASIVGFLIHYKHWINNYSQNI